MGTLDENSGFDILDLLRLPGFESTLRAGILGFSTDKIARLGLVGCMEDGNGLYAHCPEHDGEWRLQISSFAPILYVVMLPAHICILRPYM